MSKTTAKKSAPLGLTPARRKQALSAYARSGVLAHVASHLGVNERTLRRWRADHSDFDAEMRDAAEQVTVQIGQLARHRLLEYFESVGTLVEVSRRETRDNRGNPFTEVDHRRVELSPSLVKTALHKLDPAWTTAPKEQLAKMEESLEELLKRTDAEDAKQRGSD